jgi:PAS domain S-box-containing protein
MSHDLRNGLGEPRLRENQPAELARATGPELRISTLQWAVGVYNILLGALMLVVPHQFSGPLWGALKDELPTIGYLFLLTGAALVNIPASGVSRSWSIPVHFAAAAVLLTLVCNNVLLGFWGGADLYAVLALGTILAPFATGMERQRRRYSSDFFALVFGTVCASYGALRLLLPDHFTALTLDPTWPYLWLYGSTFLATNPWLFGAAFLVAGAALVAVQLFPTPPAALYRAAHLAILVPCLSYAAAASIPLLAWTGILLYIGFSLLVASLPWTGQRLRSIDPHSFSVRLAFLLAVATALPLIVMMGDVTSSQEGTARAQAEAGMEANASAIAGDVSNYVGSYRNAVIALAAFPGLLDLPAEAQRNILQRFAQAYPDTDVFSTYNSLGKGIARSDFIPPLADISPLEVFQKPKNTGDPAIVVQTSSTLHVPIFAIGAAIRSADGTFVGEIGSSLQSQSVALLLNKASEIPSSRVYMVDTTGRAIAHPDQSLVANFADLSSTPVVAGVLASSDDRGVVSSADPNGDVLAAYARVPDLGWSVVVEQPTTAALATVRAGRNGAFGLLLGAVLAAVVAGTLLARQLAGPLAALSRASSRLATGDSTPSLPLSGASEIRQLVATFGEMRDQLGARAAERERLLKRLQDQTEQLQMQNKELLAQSEALQSQSEELQVQYEKLQDRGQELRRLAGEARQSEERYRSLFGRIDQAFTLFRVIRDEAGVPIDLLYLDVNPAWERFGGLSAADVVGKPMNEVTPELTYWLGLATRVLSNGEPIRTERFSEKFKRWMELYVYSPGDDLIASLGTDITERKESEAEKEQLLGEVQRRAAELASILNNMVDAVLVCDAERRLTIANQAAVRLLGVDERGQTHLTIQDVLPILQARHRDGSPLLPDAQPLARALAGETLREEELIVRIPGMGRDVHLRVTASPLRDWQGEIAGAVSLSRDVTELSELERLKDQFIAVAAHELKTPIAIMKGYAQMLLRQSGDIPPNRRKMLESIDRGADRIDGVVQDLLDISRLQEGRLELSMERIDLSQLAEQVADEMSLSTTRHQLRVAGAEPLIVEGDRSRLEQVIVNLLDNASRYSPQGGEVEVELTRTGSEAVVSITDHGVGIPADKQGRIFQRFYRAHTDTPYDYGGMGVSLYISREIVSRHGGKLWFESQEGQGSTFSFSLPLLGEHGQG